MIGLALTNAETIDTNSSGKEEAHGMSGAKFGWGHVEPVRTVFDEMKFGDVGATFARQRSAIAAYSFHFKSPLGCNQLLILPKGSLQSSWSTVVCAVDRLG